jgi:hypothetical protein
VTLQFEKINIFFVFRKDVEKVLPNLFAKEGCQFGVVKRELDTRAKGFIKCADTVGG